MDDVGGFGRGGGGIRSGPIGYKYNDKLIGANEGGAGES